MQFIIDNENKKNNTMSAVRLIAFVTIICLVFSCQESKHKAEVIQKIQIENYIDSITKKFPGFKSNSLITDELNDFLKEDFKKSINSGILLDLPFQLHKVEKCNNKFVITLEHSLTSKFYKRGLLNQLELDLYAFTDEQTAKALREDLFYTVDVRFIEYITFENNEKYCAYVLRSPFIGYYKFDDELKFGAIGVQLKNINLFSQTKPL